MNRRMNRKQRRAKNKDQWIPVSKRIPKDFLNDILVCFEDEYVCTSIFINGKFALDGRKHGKVVAWIELPKPFYWWKKGKRKSEWISIKDRKAPRYKRILVRYKNGHIDETVRFTGFLLEGLYGPVLYWMPLPKPYKGESV